MVKIHYLNINAKMSEISINLMPFCSSCANGSQIEEKLKKII